MQGSTASASRRFQVANGRRLALDRHLAAVQRHRHGGKHASSAIRHGLLQVKPQLISAWWLWTLIGACSGAGQPGKVADDATVGSSLPCNSPDQAGCAKCCVEQWGPGAGERMCYRRAASDSRGQGEPGHEYVEQATFLKVGPCPATCRQCAACTRDRKKSYERLLSRGCDCSDPFVREVVRSIDPCFSDGCGCICSQLAGLSECGPPI